jgi:hypothetical protein
MMQVTSSDKQFPHTYQGGYSPLGPNKPTSLMATQQLHCVYVLTCVATGSSPLPATLPLYSLLSCDSLQMLMYTKQVEVSFGNNVTIIMDLIQKSKQV